MFNAQTVMDEFMGLVGWDKDPNPAETSVIDDMLTSSSGLKFNLQHALLTHQNLKSIADKFSEYTYPAYSSGTTYSKGDLVSSSGKYYASVDDANIGNVVTDTTKWRETNPYNEWLRQRTRSGIVNCLNDWYSLKVSVKTAHSLLSRDWLLNPPGYQYTTYTPNKPWVGFKITPTPYSDVIITIERASLQTLSTGSVDLKLYRNGNDTPINTYTVSTIGGDNVQKDIQIQLERGNYYYLAFNSTGLSLINSISAMEQYNWPSVLFPNTRPFVEVSAFEHAGPGESGWKDITQLFNSNNFGLNISITAKCDMTGFLTDQKSLFAPAIAKKVGMDLLRELVFNPNARINRNEENVPRETILYELDGNVEMNKYSIRNDYEKLLQGLTFDFRQMSKYCLPERRDKVKTKAT